MNSFSCPFFPLLFTDSITKAFAVLSLCKLSKFMGKTDVDFNWKEFCIKKGLTCVSYTFCFFPVFFCFFLAFFSLILAFILAFLHGFFLILFPSTSRKHSSPIFKSSTTSFVAYFFFIVFLSLPSRLISSSFFMSSTTSLLHSSISNKSSYSFRWSRCNFYDISLTSTSILILLSQFILIFFLLVSFSSTCLYLCLFVYFLYFFLGFLLLSDCLLFFLLRFLCVVLC